MRPVALRRALLLLGTLLCLFLPAATGAIAAQSPGTTDSSVTDPELPRHILIGTHGVTWDDVLTAGNDAGILRQFATNATIAQAIATTGTDRRCAMDGWLTLNTGTRITDRVGDVCRPVAVDLLSHNPVDVSHGANHIEVWPEIVQQTAGQSYRPLLGLFAERLDVLGVAAAAIGPGAAVALADADGAVSSPVTMPTSAHDIESTVAHAVADSQLVVVDAASLGTRALGSAPAAQSTTPVQVRELDAVLERVIAGLYASSIDVNHVSITVVSLTDDGAHDAAGTMQFFASTTVDLHGSAGDRDPAAGGDSADGGGLARSSATRQDGLVLTTDIAATVLAQLGAPADQAAGIGTVISRAAGGPATADGRFDVLRDSAQRAAAGSAAQVPVLVVLGCYVLLVAIAATWVRRWRQSSRARFVVQCAALGLACAPASVLLASGTGWWRTSSPAAALIAFSTLFAAALTIVIRLIARQRTWGLPRRSVAVILVSATTWLMITVDVVRGAVWSSGSPLGTQPLQAGRFYGMNNTAFSFFAVATLVLVGVVGTLLVKRFRGRGLAGVVVFSAVAVAIDVAPGIGADFGGGLALVPGLVIAVLAVAGVKLTWRRVAVGVLGAAVLVLAVGAVDALRPVTVRTHLGTFVGDLWSEQTVVTVQRKFNGAFGVLIEQPLVGLAVIVAAVGAAAIVWLWHGFIRLPVWSWAVVVTFVAGSLLNDSGLAIAAWMAMFSGALVVVRYGTRPAVVRQSVA